MVESPPVGAGEIKIRLFITPILFLLGRGRSQTVNCQLLKHIGKFCNNNLHHRPQRHSYIVRYNTCDRNQYVRH
ncbi:MAG: hypothetical protein JGK08_21990 [Microcoleus sp. PH2017_04_SCI_O_A]|uniref:hypothetical protein n=1 Tax=unclassified Microcoleus TaxID=2642155 RepID=UPI001E12428D|nr:MULTISPECIES: hypothetical protein [unclassified Microcoleus]MCC3432576.1 hypothetical protein [Microcoleus sp. PH2017_04_SCI_O_A]MCC3548808.1 hypothetical protein [Microcoleus sp. PH2017_24_DOB_U_A]MCC3565131.1 hypothetical protein [Microcoleus sp. PH2017_31_RDM_U_A]